MHEHFMGRALDLAQKGKYSTKPNPRVGCVLVKDNQIIGEGYHYQAGMPHAEIEALADANKKGLGVLGATAYVSLEPCAHFGRTGPCAQALVDAGIKKVVIGTKDPNPLVAGKGIEILQNAGIEIALGVLEKFAQDINLAFMHKMRTKKPLIVGKLGMSIDGKIALANGASKWITGKMSRQKVQDLRAKSDCILTGIGSILADDSRLNVRLDELGEFLEIAPDSPVLQGVVQPFRCVLDSKLQIPLDAKVIGTDGKAIIIASEEYSRLNFKAFLAKKNQLESLGSKVFLVPIGYNGRLDLDAVINLLAQLNFNQVLLEAGSRLSGSFVEQNLLDMLYIFQAPIILGNTAKSAFGIASFKDLTNLADLPQSKYFIHEIAKYEADICLKLKKQNKQG